LNLNIFILFIVIPIYIQFLNCMFIIIKIISKFESIKKDMESELDK